jgi:hypothetical protein
MKHSFIILFFLLNLTNIWCAVPSLPSPSYGTLLAGETPLHSFSADFNKGRDQLQATWQYGYIYDEYELIGTAHSSAPVTLFDTYISTATRWTAGNNTATSVDPYGTTPVYSSNLAYYTVIRCRVASSFDASQRLVLFVTANLANNASCSATRKAAISVVDGGSKG